MMSLTVQCLPLNDTLPYFTPCSSVSIVDFEQANVGWEKYL